MPDHELIQEYGYSPHHQAAEEPNPITLLTEAEKQQILERCKQVDQEGREIVAFNRTVKVVDPEDEEARRTMGRAGVDRRGVSIHILTASARGSREYRVVHDAGPGPLQRHGGVDVQNRFLEQLDELTQHGWTVVGYTLQERKLSDGAEIEDHLALLQRPRD